MEKKAGWLSWVKIQKADPTLVAVSFGHGITDWYQNSLFIILPYLSKDLGLTYSQVGILMGWNYFTNFFVNLPGGLIVDMVGKTGLLLGLAVALTGLPYFFLGFSTSYVMAMVVITFVGIGINLWHPAALSFLARRYPDRKGFAISLHAMGGHLGNTFCTDCHRRGPHLPDLETCAVFQLLPWSPHGVRFVEAPRQSGNDSN